VENPVQTEQENPEHIETPVYCLLLKCLFLLPKITRLGYKTRKKDSILAEQENVIMQLQCAISKLHQIKPINRKGL
jgi:hypothetical protein